MTVYTDNPFGGFGGGMRNLRMPRPPINQPQIPPMNQMPRRMLGGPSKGGTTSIPMRRPPMQRPGGPGKGRARLPGYGGRGRGRPMPGGPGKGRGQMQQPMPQPNFGQIGFPARPSFDQLMTQGPMSMPRPTPTPRFGQMGPPSNLQFQQAGNNRPAPEFMGEVGQAFTQGPTSIPNSPFMRQQMGFYGGGITDLY